jgi:hypothetical protein
VEKKKIDDSIKEARVALSVIEQETAKIDSGMRESDKEDTEYQTNYVRLRLSDVFFLY